MENTMNNRNEIPQQVKQVVSIAETLLQGQILGMYLYGSATMNKLRPDSDIDILIITRQELNLSTKKELTKQLLEISGFVGCAESIKKTLFRGSFRPNASICMGSGFGKRWKPE